MRTMARGARLVFLLAVIALWLAALRPAASWALTQGAGLAGTAHDFTLENGGTNTMDVGLCTFCHTPHKALTTMLLWNHTLSTNTFSWDEPKTTAGTDFPSFIGDVYTGPTAKCLSCHDGSVAIGDVAWFEEGKPSPAINSDVHTAGDTYNVGYGGNMKGNHPVAMPYPYQNVANTYNGVTTGSAAYLDEWQATPLAPIRIFHDEGGGTIVAGVAAGTTGIECSSCHDPHNKKAVDDLFLRGKISGSDTTYICLKCHMK